MFLTLCYTIQYYVVHFVARLVPALVPGDSCRLFFLSFTDEIGDGSPGPLQGPPKSLHPSPRTPWHS